MTVNTTPKTKKENVLQPMTNEFYKTGIYKADHRTYGGELTQFDFEGRNTMVSMAGKIQQGCSFDKLCKTNIEIRSNAKKDRRTS